MPSSDLKKLSRRAAGGVLRLLPVALRQRIRPAVRTPQPPATPRALPLQDMDPQEDLHAFWRQPAPHGNVPRTYIGPVQRSKVLLQLLADLPQDARILEVGCNVGRNLAYLYDHGYTSLQGIEINPHAVELLRETYPQLADVPVHVGPAEEILPELPADSFDLVYTMAVIEHIHPDASAVFDEMVRVGSSILAIEPAGRRSHRQYPHDVPEIFRARGMRMVSSRPMTEFPELQRDRGLRPFTAYRFVRSDTAVT